jgi:predicted ester cyclase
MATREVFRKFHRSFCGTFPELKIRIAQIVSEGSDVAARLECEGRHVAAPAGTPPITFGAMVFATVRNGVLVEGWNLVDEAAIARGIQVTAAVG